MFTGIVEELGEVVDLVHTADSARLTVRGPGTVYGARAGDSIAVNGCCLTVTTVSDGTFTADVMAESLRRTGLADISAGDRVNLELPVTLQSRLGGHLVQGHVDGTGRITERVSGTSWDQVCVAMPEHLARYVVSKGSIAVDGVSLTVVEVDDVSFTVSLVPTTLARTTLGAKQVGDVVNLEVDVLAKYVERLLGERVR